MKVLIIGLGSIAAKHIKALQLIDVNSELFALRSSKESSPYEGVKNIYTLEDIKNLSIDFAIVSNPTFAHYDTIQKLIPYKIPLFIEKPLFSGLDDGKMVKTINGSKAISYVACNLRFLECLSFAKRYIGQKRINEVNVYCGSYLPDWRPGTDYKTTYSANKEMGGGVHIDLIHEIDYTYWFFGVPTRVNKLFSNKSSLNISAFDYANYNLEYTNFSASIILNYYRRDPKRTMEIVLEDETVLVDVLKNKVYVNNGVVFESDKSIIDTYEDQLRFFIEEIVTGNKEFNTIAEAYEILKICLQND